MSHARMKVLAVGALLAALLFALEYERPPAASPSPKELRTPLNIVRSGTLSRAETLAFGRLFTLEATGVGEGTDDALRAAIDELEALDRLLSPWRPGSDLWALNARAGQEPIEVDTRTHEILTLALSLSSETDGLYSPFLGELRTLWPFGDRSRPLPLRRELQEALERLGRARLSFDPEGGALLEAGTRVSLEGLDVAQGMHAAMEILEAHGIEHALVRAGDDVLTRGHVQTPRAAVAIANPRWPDRVIARFAVHDRAAVTIDDMHGALIRQGVVLASVLDPRSGEPARGCRSVTVVADNARQARAHAVAIFVLGADDGLAWVEGIEGLAAMVVDARGQVHRSARWSTMIDPVAAQVWLGNPQSANAQSPNRPDREIAEPGDPGMQGRSASRESTSQPLSDRGLVTIAAEGPRPAFRLDAMEVTNAQYTRFLAAERIEPHRFCHPEEPRDHDHRPRYHRRFSPPMVLAGFAGALAPFREQTFRDPLRPVVGVDYWDAWAFARWSGKRLPTREELSRACGGAERRSWPFGDTWDPSRVNSGGERDGEHDGHIYAAPADSFSQGATPEGCLNLAGNVAEWTSTRWVMGGSSRSNPSQVACGAERQREAGFRAFDLGFRCAADIEPRADRMLNADSDTRRIP